MRSWRTSASARMSASPTSRTQRWTNWQAATCFNEVQRAALAFTDEIIRLRRPTDATFKAIAAKLTPAALVELQLSVGFYIMTSKFLETFDIDMQPVEAGGLSTSFRSRR